MRIIWMHMALVEAAINGLPRFPNVIDRVKTLDELKKVLPSTDGIIAPGNPRQQTRPRNSAICYARGQHRALGHCVAGREKYEEMASCRTSSTSGPSNIPRRWPGNAMAFLLARVRCRPSPP